MSNQESWIENAEKYALFLNEGDSGEAGKLLEISPTNRTIAGKRQGVILATLRFSAGYYRSLYPERKTSYAWIDGLCDLVEEYQLTIDNEQNSRRQFMKTVIGNTMNFLKGGKKDGQEAITK